MKPRVMFDCVDSVAQASLGAVKPYCIPESWRNLHKQAQEQDSKLKAIRNSLKAVIQNNKVKPQNQKYE
ncbi:MAG: hypothetical protein KatS3mg087_2186 [Patescibacteria group bacterium]|nr:MAG: hypothetical protein KatS3mg087_2186 [Patescibacteria group bacterium]